MKCSGDETMLQVVQVGDPSRCWDLMFSCALARCTRGAEQAVVHSTWEEHLRKQQSGSNKKLKGATDSIENKCWDSQLLR